MNINFDDNDIRETIAKYVKENRITIEQGLDIIYNYAVMGSLEMQLWDIETAIDEGDSLADVKNLFISELDSAENEYNEFLKECNIKL